MMNRLFYILFFLVCFSAKETLSSEPFIGIVVKSGFRGECEFAERMRIACERLHWKSTIIEQKSFLGEQYDWIMALTPGKVAGIKQNHYLVLFDPEHHYFDQKGHLLKEYRNFTGYLTTYDDNLLLLEDVKLGKSKIYSKRWYPTVQYREYKKVNPQQLFFFIGLWGDRRNHHRYIAFQHALAQAPYACLFGDPLIGKSYAKAFKGEIRSDGESVINMISQLGVCLILHSETHLRYGIPSGRIFEAAAASAVIISDLNPFVMEHFGESVLYLNQELSGEEMFAQIDRHMKWIKDNPEEALKMAKQSHQIFEENFLLEQQLLDFYDFVQIN